MLTNVLNAPVSELTMGNNVNAGEYFFNTGVLPLI